MGQTGKLIRDLVSDESGQDMMEYALVAALLGLSAVAALHTLSSRIATVFTGIGTTFTNAV